jgi:hypothetical protein
MLLAVHDVTITAIDLGKAEDNYNLNSDSGDAWAADYMVPPEELVGSYLPPIGVGADFPLVVGILEQYMKLSSGWDYYQLLTRGLGDLVVPGDFDIDADVDAFDLLIWQAGFGMLAPTYFDGDADFDADVDAFDLLIWQNNFGYGSGASPVPEPLAVVLLTTALAAMWFGKRCR